MTKFQDDRRSGMERRQFHYTAYIPERRSGKDRRCAKNGKEILWIKHPDRIPEAEQQDSVIKNLCGSL